MDFKQLAVFTVVAEELHFAHAAKRLHMTASALTRHIQRLEQSLAVQLLLRNNRQVELTPAGVTFLHFAKEVLEREQQLKHDLSREAVELSGQLKIYSSVTASYGLLPQLLKDFRQRFSGVEVKLHTGDQAVALARVEEGLEDLAVAAMPENLPETLAFKTLVFSKLCFIMPSESLALSADIDRYQAEPNLQHFMALPMIIAEQGLARSRFDAWVKANAVEANIYAEVSGHEAIVSMVALGMGVGLVPEIVIQHSPLQGKIAVIEAAPELQAFQIGLCAQKRRLAMPAIKAFWQAAK